MGRKIKNILVFCITIILITLIFSSIKVDSEMKKPNYRIGQFWHYQLKMFYGNKSFIGNSSFKVVAKEKIDINNTKFSAFNCSESIEIPNYNNLSIKNNFYVLTFDNSVMKVISKKTINDNITKEKVVYSGSGFRSIYWPLTINKTWTNNITKNTYDETGNLKKENLSINYKCTNTTELSIANTYFDCYIVKRWESYESKDLNYTLYYYSPEVGGRYVQRLTYQNGQLTGIYNLTDYNYSKEKSDYNMGAEKYDVDLFNNFILILIILIFALGIVVILIKKIK